MVRHRFLVPAFGGSSPSSPAISELLCYTIYIENNETQLNKFIEEYNSLFNVPNYKANAAICLQYRKDHENEFRTSDWAIEKHRKRFMDWMSRQKESDLQTIGK